MFGFVSIISKFSHVISMQIKKMSNGISNVISGYYAISDLV